MFFQEFLNILVLNYSVQVLFPFTVIFFSFEEFISVQEVLGGKFILTSCKGKIKTVMKPFYLKTKNTQNLGVGRKAE